MGAKQISENIDFQRLRKEMQSFVLGRGMWCPKCDEWVMFPTGVRNRLITCDCGKRFNVYAELGRRGGSRPKRFSRAELQKRRERLAVARANRW